jgi:hypothetical protein
MSSLSQTPTANVQQDLPYDKERVLSYFAGIRSLEVAPKMLTEVSKAAVANGTMFFEPLIAAKDSTPEYEQTRSSKIINQIPFIIELEKSVGRDFGILMSITEADFVMPKSISSVTGLLKEEWLTGAAKIIFDFCKDNGFAPTLEYWDDIRFYFQGFQIIIHFPDSEIKRVPEENLANEVISQINMRAVFAAQRGGYWSEIMSIDPEIHLTDEGKELASRSQVLNADHLLGAAKEVFIHCQENNLLPDVQYWAYTSGSNDSSEGYSIVVHWER